MPRQPQTQLTVDEVRALPSTAWEQEMLWKELWKLALNVSYDEEWGDATSLRAMVHEVLDHEQFRTLHAHLVKRAEECLVLLEYARFPLATQDEITRVLQTSLVFLLHSDSEMKKKIAKTLTLHRDGDQNGKERHAMIRAFRENGTERIGREPIFVKGDQMPVPPVVKNWLRDYEHFFEEFKERGPVDEVHYMNQNVNARKLIREDKTLLMSLLQLYDFLFFPYLQKEPEEVGRDIGGAIQPPRVVAPRTEERNAPPPTPRMLFDDGTVLAATQALQGRVQPTQIFDAVYSIIEPASGGKPKRIEVLAALRVLAERGLLSALLRDDRRMREEMERLLVHQVRSDLVNGFRMNQTLPVYVSIFLQYVLLGKLTLQPEEGAEIVASLLPFLPQTERVKYQKIVYYDIQQRKWDWT